MSAMSAPSAAPAGLMPLSLIAEHKTAQAPPAVQPLPRSGTDKCVNPAGNIVKPTSNGMEGSGPLPLVSQLPSSTASLPTTMTELTAPQHNTNPSTNSDVNVQLPTPTHTFQNLAKTDSVTAQDGSGTPFGSTGVSGILSGERRHTEENVHHHHMSTTITPFSSVNPGVVDQHSRGISAQLLQLQPSQQAVHQTSAATVNISPDTTTSPTAITIGNNNTVMSGTGSSGSSGGSGTTGVVPTNATTASTQSVTTTVTLLEESSSRTQVSSTSTTQITTVETATSLHKQLVQQSSTEIVSQTQTSSTQQQSSTVGQSSNDSQLPGSVNSPPKTTQNTASSLGATPITSTPSTTTTTSTLSSSQPALSTDNNVMKVATIPRQPSKRTTKAATILATSQETPKKTGNSDPLREKETTAGDDKPRRTRLPTQPYQSPIPEFDKRTPNSAVDKLIVFYRNEFLAVRNAEGSFYICQAMQNVYKSSSRIRIRWLSQQPDPSSDIYTPDFYDHTEFDCILTNLNLERVDKDKYRLPQPESRRTESILKRALDVERGVAPPPATDDTLTETHPDGLDLSLYRNEEQLKKRKKNKKKMGKKRELSAEEEKRPAGTGTAGGTTRRKTGSSGGSTISASAVAKAKKAAAIKRTAAVKRVVLQAAAARRQAAAAAAASTAKKSTVTTGSNKSSASSIATTKKEAKAQPASTAGSKRKAAPVNTQSPPEKRTRRGTVASQPAPTTPVASQAKGRGSTSGVSSGSTGNTTNNKNSTSNNNSGSSANNINNSSTNQQGGNNNNNNSTPPAGGGGGTRRTLRNSK